MKKIEASIKPFKLDAVREALVARGIAPELMTAVGYGESQPIADNETDEGKAANRRTEIVWSERQ